VQFNCVKKLHEKLKGMFSGTEQVSNQFCQVFVSSVCLLVPVTLVDKNKAVVLLFASHIGHNVIRKEEKKA
jgi:hypothetical protein